MPAYAHSHPNLGQPWEPLFTPFGEGDSFCQRENCQKCENLECYHGHLNMVAWWSAKFATEMFSPDETIAKSAWDWGYLAGLWHDLGKFPEKWQRYLAAKADPHADDISEKVDHSSAGAQHAVRQHPLLGHFLAYAIAGHHSGLLDTIASGGASQVRRLEKSDLPSLEDVPREILDLNIPRLPSVVGGNGFSSSLFMRMIFSCLVDADFLATESFMNSSQKEARNRVPEKILQQIQALIDTRIDSFGTPCDKDVVNFQRRKVVENCREKALEAPGLFTLTVPTGGGKTLSSLSFALRHAIAHGQRRIIYVVPFTSIIEQNADVIRKIVSSLETEYFTPFIEHHSALSPEKDKEKSRLAAENWDAPIIMTTAVQFYESLFAAKTSRARKLHNIANSVVILDEAQTLPVDYLTPCLKVLQELADHYRTTTVLCTATQPAVHHEPEEFEIGLRNCREIINDPGALFSALKRVSLHYLGAVSDADLVRRIAEQSQVLCIVNRRKHAQELYQLLGEGEGKFHLSALMCPEHRSQILEDVKKRLLRKMPVRLISTQLIEAGVDVDFPVVYRAMAGLDSIAQAAGRCNRNGKISIGDTYIFEPEDTKGETYFRETAQVARELIELYPDDLLLSQKAIYHYFDYYYYQQSKRWDFRGILDEFRLDPRDKVTPFKFQFSTAADNFRLIDERQVPVIIPFDRRAEELIKLLKNEFAHLDRSLLRSLQRYTVQISPELRDRNIRSFDVLREGQFHALINKQLNYSEDFGLVFNDEYSGRQFIAEV